MGFEVKGERFKNITQALPFVFEFNLYYNPYHKKHMIWDVVKLVITQFLYFISKVEFRVRSPASQYIFIQK